MSRLHEILLHLLGEAQSVSEQSDRPHQGRQLRHLQNLRHRLHHLEASSHIDLLRRLLCTRHPDPPLPDSILAEIDLMLHEWRSHRLLTLAESIPPALSFARGGATDGTISVWQGDITTLSNVTAISNAANSCGLGCFQPSHRCIDNAIHAAAGPRLRHDCHLLMTKRGRGLDPGDCIVTAGHCLPAAHVVHVVGPQLLPGAAPGAGDRDQLARCYRSVLDAAEALPAGDDGGKRVAFCGISTGLFAFPAREAAVVAVKAVAAWLQGHPQTTITAVIFNTFTSADHSIYREILSSPPPTWRPRTAPSPDLPVIRCASLDRARMWLRSADAVVVSAGAGLSASDGLDYNSTTLFAKEFPGFLRYGFRTLYSVFGFSAWKNEQDRWGYYFTHLGLVKSWPKSVMYRTLISWLGKFGSDAHVRTSNADGLFVANGWEPEKLSTPQGSYSVLQCLANCRPDSTEPSERWLAAAQPSLDPESQRLVDPAKIPRCRNCGGAMGICVRAGSWFNDSPFRDGERCWGRFKKRMQSERKRVVILELGVGTSTPGVLRWPNEDLARESDGKVHLVRVGIGPESAVPSDLEKKGLAASIDGDVAAVIRDLFGSSQ